MGGMKTVSELLFDQVDMKIKAHHWYIETYFNREVHFSLSLSPHHTPIYSFPYTFLHLFLSLSSPFFSLPTAYLLLFPLMTLGTG